MHTESKQLTEEINSMYYNAAKEFAGNYKVTSNHICSIIKLVMLHRDGYINGGGFVTAVVNNDLYSAVGRADEECYANLKVIVAAKSNCYVSL